jgi:hypothetical protein
MMWKMSRLNILKYRWENGKFLKDIDILLGHNLHLSSLKLKPSRQQFL